MDAFAYQNQVDQPPAGNQARMVPNMNFDSLRSLTEQVKKSISYWWTISICFGILMLINDGSEWGIDASHILKMAILIKMLFQVPFNWSILNCARTNKITPASGKIIITVLEPFILFSWYWKVTSQFFSSDNDCRKKATPLWVGHFVLIIEAFGCFFLSWIFWCVISIIWVLVARALKKQRKDKINNMKIKDMLLKAASFKLSPQDILAKEECPICFAEFEPDQNILQLPCNDKHVFHADWIGEWVGRNNTCPLWKTEITKNLIKDFKKTNNGVRPQVLTPDSDIENEERNLRPEENKV